MHVTFLRIFIYLLTLSQTCFAQGEVQYNRSQYPIKVQDGKTGDVIFNAKVTIDLLGYAPINVFTDSDGFARIFIEETQAGNPGRLTVKAEGYRIYVQNIDLNTKVLTHVIQLEPE
jgi:hypothetical protein